MRGYCSVSILSQNHPQRVTWTETFYGQLKNVDLGIRVCHSTCWVIKSTGISIKLLWEYLMHLNWIKHASNPCGLNNSTGRAAGWYLKCASSNPSQVNIFSRLQPCQIIMKSFCLWDFPTHIWCNIIFVKTAISLIKGFLYGNFGILQHWKKILESKISFKHCFNCLIVVLGELHTILHWRCVEFLSDWNFKTIKSGL